jgi:2C-methyl-D-erythritol 2,4-cyclodiphosphate synthase
MVAPVGGGVERYRESDGQILLHQLADAVNVSAGREGDVAVTDADSALVVYETKEAEDVIVIVHRLADAHKYYV